MDYEESVFVDIIKSIQNMETAIYLGDNLMDKLDWNSTKRVDLKHRNQVINLMKNQIKEARTLPKKFTEELNLFLNFHTEKINRLKPNKRKMVGKEKKSKKQREMSEIVIEECELQVKEFEEPEKMEIQEKTHEEPQEPEPQEPHEEPPTIHEEPPEIHQEVPPENWQP